MGNIVSQFICVFSFICVSLMGFSEHWYKAILNGAILDILEIAVKHISVLMKGYDLDCHL